MAGLFVLQPHRYDRLLKRIIGVGMNNICPNKKSPKATNLRAKLFDNQLFELNYSTFFSIKPALVAALIIINTTNAIMRNSITV